MFMYRSIAIISLYSCNSQREDSKHLFSCFPFGCSSPHLVQVRERIRINGQPIGKELFTKYFWQVYGRLDETKVGHVKRRRCVVFKHSPCSMYLLCLILNCQTNHGYSFTSLREMVQWINLLSKSNRRHAELWFLWVSYSCVPPENSAQLCIISVTGCNWVQYKMRPLMSWWAWPSCDSVLDSHY